MREYSNSSGTERLVINHCSSSSSRIAGAINPGSGGAARKRRQ